MIKLHSANFFIGQKGDFGTQLSEVGILDIYDSKQPILYYENGLIDIDNLFSPKGYLKNGWTSNIYSYEGYISFFFFRYERDTVMDLGVVHLNRSNITKFEKLPAQNLEVVKRGSIGHTAAYVGKRLGLVGSLIGLATDQIVMVNTEFISGWRYKLFYKDENNEEKFITLYAADEFTPQVDLFLNTYYKSQLPKEAIRPIGNSNCFIATACYRDVFAPEVIAFRKFRDEVLSKTFFGRVFISFYYAISPVFFKFLFDHPYFSDRLKILLDHFYNLLKEKK